MLGDNAAVATIPVKDSRRANAFYRDTLGLEQVDEREGVATFRSGESKVFVYESEYAGANKATAATWMVNDLDSIVRDLQAKGVKFEHYPDMPGVKIEGDIHVADDGTMKVAWLKDPDGNILSLATDG
jgi:catechol 2,3-dioxygenase-like lactoylglutathione lyase family enzyme